MQRVKSSDSTLGEKANATLVTNAMKAKIKLGMGCKKIIKKVKKNKPLRKVIQEAKIAIKGYKPDKKKDAIKIALKAVRNISKNKKLIKISRIIPVPKTGGILPLIPIFAGLSAVGGLAGDAAVIMKAVNDVKNSKQQLIENEHHNKTMESFALRGKV